MKSFHPNSTLKAKGEEISEKRKRVMRQKKGRMKNVIKKPISGIINL
jgi:hypothetical protein